MAKSDDKHGHVSNILLGTEVISDALRQESGFGIRFMADC
jgi:hypothetical protein